MAQLLGVVPPRLPTAPQQFETRFHDQYSDVLRLYFNQLGGNVNALIGVRGGQYLNFPYAAIQRSTDVIFASNTAKQVTFNVNDFLNGCTNDGTDGVQVQQSGIYNYQFSVQFANTDSQIHTAFIWLRKNGVDIAGTGSKWDITAKHGSSDGYVLAVANFYVSLVAGDTVELWAAVSNVAVYMEAYPVQTTPFAMPSIPSVVATLSFVSSVSP